MLFGNLHIEIIDRLEISVRDITEVLCAALEAVSYKQDYLVMTLLQSLLVHAAASVTCLVVSENDYDIDEEQFCHEIEALAVAASLEKFCSLIKLDIKHARYNLSDIGVSLDDMRLTASLVFLEEFAADYEEYLLEEVSLHYERTGGPD